jgi:hypothetical protein
MDTATTTLIISQTLTFFLLIISEILPFANLPYNGILQTFVDILRKTVAVQPVPLTEMTKTAEHETIAVIPNS